MNEYDVAEQFTEKDNYRERSPIRGTRPGRGGGDKFKILLKNLPYSVNWMKLKDICKEHAGPVIFADIIKNRDGRSAGFGHVEFKVRTKNQTFFNFEREFITAENWKK